MNDINILNIPAYQRKRSIAAKGRKKPSTGRATKKIDKLEFTIDSAFPSHGSLTEPLEMNKRKQSGIREMKSCGICEGFFDKIDVAIIRLTAPLREDDIIIFEKTDGLFEQKVKSMQIDRKPVKLARTGSEIGIKVSMKPQVGGTIYKVI